MSAATPTLWGLPNEILDDIFKYLDTSDMVHLRTMCRKLEHAAFDWYERIVEGAVRARRGMVYLNMNDRGVNELSDLSKLERARMEVKYFIAMRVCFHCLEYGSITQSVGRFPNLSALCIGYYDNFMKCFRQMERFSWVEPEEDQEEFG
ncbi:uncharacterized protein K452DRAFT_301572 [Aplosporella prunicola CBS 121167]|uniref:F-box domain-containing protein n=1 Tax=Aplosporella prunicola CBS 121167 TaxID=1176127 RepID=A0A6A6B514_9PEZI|nr:uncharacterized protein K452DRAFT_301572 [Aplosporella prunicola CBS 121167]KAF2137841.1 hypothetical protein K452DRAFT_301572 [Aplosporella prunicola CBS 121167]